MLKRGRPGNRPLLFLSHNLLCCQPVASCPISRIQGRSFPVGYRLCRSLKAIRITLRLLFLPPDPKVL